MEYRPNSKSRCFAILLHALVVTPPAGRTGISLRSRGAVRLVPVKRGVTEGVSAHGYRKIRGEGGQPTIQNRKKYPYVTD